MSEASERGGRYSRSAGGLIGALLITLAVIAAFVVFRAVTRDELAVGPTPVDYLASVRVAQEEGYNVAYPPSLPPGWIANSVDLVRGERPEWGVTFLTDSGSFVGIRQEDRSATELLETYVDEAPESLPPVMVSGSVAPQWDAYADSGGDHGYAAELGEETVLVYGSAPTEDLVEVLELLTTEPLPGVDGGVHGQS